MNKAIPITSTIAIMILVNAIPTALAISTNDRTTPTLTPGYYIWHGSRYAVCPPGVPAPCANYLPNDLTTHFGKFEEVYRTSQDTWEMIRNRPIFLCLNKLEAKLIAKALKFTTRHARTEIGFTEYQMFNELTKRMQAIVRGEEKKTVDDLMNSCMDSGLDYET